MKFNVRFSNTLWNIFENMKNQCIRTFLDNCQPRYYFYTRDLAPPCLSRPQHFKFWLSSKNLTWSILEYFVPYSFLHHKSLSKHPLLITFSLLLTVSEVCNISNNANFPINQQKKISHKRPYSFLSFHRKLCSPLQKFLKISTFPHIFTRIYRE